MEIHRRRHSQSHRTPTILVLIAPMLGSHVRTPIELTGRPAEGVEEQLLELEGMKEVERLREGLGKYNLYYRNSGIIMALEAWGLGYGETLR